MMNAPLALLALLSATPSHAHRLPSCLKASTMTQSLADLRDCQEESLEKFRVTKDAKGALPTQEDFDALDEKHRAEARRLMANSKEVIKGPSTEPSSAPDLGSQKGAAPALKPGESLPAGAHPGQLGGVTPDDLSRADKKSAADIRALQDRLHAAAGDGGNGITPAMVDDIKQTLGGAQGSLSPDMQALLDAVSKDGGKLTPETMKLLQNAAKSAKGQGLNPNIDPNTEKGLLEHDFDSDKSAPGGM